MPAQLPDVVARVNGEAINRAALEEAVSEVEARAGQPMPADQRDRVLRAVLDQLIGYRLLVQETAARKTAVPDADVDARIGQIRSQFPSEEVFQQQLQQRKMTLEQLRADTRASMQITALLQAELEAKIAVTPEQVNDFYVKNPAAFQQGERVKASHILVRVQANADAAEREKARAKAAGVLEDVKAGKDFAALAKQHSEDPGSGANGGDLGFFQRGQMVPPFDQAAFTLAAWDRRATWSRPSSASTSSGWRRSSRAGPCRSTKCGRRSSSISSARTANSRRVSSWTALKAKGKVEIFI